LAIGLLIAAGFVLRGSSFGLIPWVIFLLIVYAVGACLWWGILAWRHRRPDPWAYDAELDGPIAEAFEGRSYADPRKR
jgi:hypothetical protein